MNAITVEQTQEEMALAFQVHRRAELAFVRLAQAKVSSLPLDEAPKAPIILKFGIKSRKAQAPKGTLRIRVDFQMTGEPKLKSAPKGKLPRKPVVVAKVACTYELDYQLQKGFEPSAKQVRAFKDGNVVFNCWPYFREYLQESIQRMGYPPLTAPFLRVLPKLPKKKDEPPAKSVRRR